MTREFNDKEKDIFNLLKRVIDPELMVNIIDLGLVYDVRLDETLRTIEVDLTLTSPGCPLGDVIMGDVEHVVKNENDGFQVMVNLVWEPIWTLDRLTEKGNEVLGRT